jgi:hypothetical protein
MGVVYVDIERIMDVCGSAEGPVKVPHFLAMRGEEIVTETFPTNAEHNAMVLASGSATAFDEEADGVIPGWSGFSTAQKLLVRSAYYPGAAVPT